MNYQEEIQKAKAKDGDYYANIAPLVKAYLEETLAPIRITKFSFDDWMMKYDLTVDARIPDVKSIQDSLEKLFDRVMCIYEPEDENRLDYIIDSMLVPDYECLTGGIGYIPEVID